MSYPYAARDTPLGNCARDVTAAAYSAVGDHQKQRALVDAEYSVYIDGFAVSAAGLVDTRPNCCTLYLASKVANSNHAGTVANI